MRRGQRGLWRAVADAAGKVAASRNHAEEYWYGMEFAKAMETLEASATKKGKVG